VRSLLGHVHLARLQTLDQIVGRQRLAILVCGKRFRHVSSERIKVDVEDNGRGFDAEAAFSGDEAHLEPREQALLTLRETFELVGGSVAVTSSETDGTHIHLELPASDESLL
jgi:signal transduction histidine kinase